MRPIPHADSLATRATGPAILLEAVALATPTQRMTERSLREAVLYHTLPREVGRWADWQRRVLRAARKVGGGTKGALEAGIFDRSSAERFAERQRARLRAAGVMPFGTLD